MSSSVVSHFTTGTSVDLIGPSIVSVTPANGAQNVVRTAAIQLGFSKQIKPLTVNEFTFQVNAQSTGTPIAGLISVSADGLTATLTPTSPLNTSATYFVQATGVTDFVGQRIGSFSSSFVTGLSEDNTHAIGGSHAQAAKFNAMYQFYRLRNFWR